ncbi:hypothetical protein Taro_028500 [Colocasia esculenta]|uniref:Legume lectin domain-containing protein n=1 Tax=Colocasia esculenta TaxID=4460 RepID=A0A843VIS6_COLES|nr:hypothetical protein [Colocasia esculenta]
MGVSTLLRCSVLLSFCWIFFVARFARSVAQDASFSFSFRAFERPSSFEPEIALYGDAQVINSSVRITSAREQSRGRITYGKPLAFGRKPSFSTYFSFSISPGKGEGDGLAFLIAPSNVQPESLDGFLFGVAPGVFAVEFDTSMDSQSGDPKGNHVGIYLGTTVSCKTGNVSKLNLVLNSGEKLQTWIEYHGDTKILEVRLSKFGSRRPSKALISYPVDLSGLIWRNAMSVSISSWSGNSTQTSNLYSWSFRLKHAAAYLLHSEPLYPGQFVDAPKGPIVHLRRGYLSGVMIGLILGAACGAIATIIILFACGAFMDRFPVAPVGFPVLPVQYGYEKSMVAGEKAFGTRHLYQKGTSFPSYAKPAGKASRGRTKSKSSSASSCQFQKEEPYGRKSDVGISSIRLY